MWEETVVWTDSGLCIVLGIIITIGFGSSIKNLFSFSDLKLAAVYLGLG